MGVNRVRGVFAEFPEVFFTILLLVSLREILICKFNL